MSDLIRIVSALLASGHIFGLGWYFRDHSLAEWFPPVFLLFLAVMTGKHLKRLWPVLLFGALCVAYSYVAVGLPLLRPHVDFYSEVWFAIELGLVTYLSFRLIYDGAMRPPADRQAM